MAPRRAGKAGRDKGPSTTPVGSFQDGSLYEHGNVAKEDDEVLQALANDKNTALIAYIGSYVGVRVSPIHYLSATITLLDEFGIETVIGELEKAKVDRAYFLINSFGGSMDSAYKIARALRSSLKEIVTFVPHIAASGGTLFTLTGNTIVMGPMSNITPMDPQLYYNGNYISAMAGRRAFDRAVKFFEKKTEDEAPYPHKAFADRIDPFIFTEWENSISTAHAYVKDILERVGYTNGEELSKSLLFGFPTHSYVITADQATRIGLSVKGPKDYPSEWKAMRHWLRKYLFEQQAENCIRYLMPNAQLTIEGTINKTEMENANAQ